MIENENNKISYLGDNINRTWEVPFPFIDANDIKIYISETDGFESEVEVSSNFEWNDQKTAIIYPTVKSGLKPLTDKQKITLSRETPITQNENSKQIAFTSADVERALDKLTMISQEIKERFKRVITLGHDIEGEASIDDLLQEIRDVYTFVKNQADIASEEAQKAIEAAVEAYEQAEKLYSSIEWYIAGTAQDNYTGDLQTFILTESFKCDGSTIKVFVNGLLKRIGDTYDYLEISNPDLSSDTELKGNTIKFNSPLQTGDTVCFMWGDTLTMPGGEVAKVATQAAESAESFAQEAQLSAEKAESELGKFIPAMVGDIVYSESQNSSDNIGRLEEKIKKTINGSDYPALQAFLENHPEKCIDSAKYIEYLDKYTLCPFYVFDKASNQIRLPTLKKTFSFDETSSSFGPFEEIKERSGVAETDMLFMATSGFNTPMQVISGTKVLLSDAGRSKYGQGSNALSFSIKRGESWSISGCQILFARKINSTNAETHYEKYPWIVSSNYIEGILKSNSGFLKVGLYSKEEWDAMEEKPQKEFCLIEEEIE